MFSLSSFLIAASVGASYGVVFYAGASWLIDRAWSRVAAAPVAESAS